MHNYTQRARGETAFQRPNGMPEALHRLLIRRGITTAAEAARFLNPTMEDLNDPFLLSDMTEAVALVRAAVERSARICVYGDYDVDGVCAAAILSEYLRSVGAETEVYLPSRHTEGYGLNDAAIRQIAERCALLITVDCGITNIDQVALARKLGMDVVVTDHHRPADASPDCPTVNPLLKGYPFGYLCGAGVAFQMVAALGGREAAMEYIDLAAIATVADIVSLTGENRAIVKLGLDSINRNPRLGVRMLLEAAGLEDRQISAGNIGFQIAPRLNAGGRVGSAGRSLGLLVERDELRAREIAEELNAENVTRRDMEQAIAAEAFARLEDFDFPAHRAIVLVGRDWNHGVIGLAASRIVERFHYPAILMTDDGQLCVGSCRSIPGIDIHGALSALSHYFVRFGGHRQAAGLTMKSQLVPEFAADLDAYLAEHIDPRAYIPTDEYDMDIDFSEMGDVFVSGLDAMQPTGMGNPAPVFRAVAGVREARAVGKDGAHLKLKLEQDGDILDAISFRDGARAAKLSGGQDILFTPKLNTYMGRTSVQLELKALNPRDNLARISANFENESPLLRRFLTDMLYNRPYQKDQWFSGELDWAGALAALRMGVQGTLVICDDLDSANRLLNELPDAEVDMCVGQYPEDPRAFNAVCVYPLGEIPAGFQRVLSQLPVSREGAQILRISAKPCAWRSELPDVDQLRELYRALRRMLSRPLFANTIEGILSALASESGFSEACALAGLIALDDMQLCSLRLDGPRARLEARRAQKSDPMQSEVFRRICALK